MTKSVKKMFKQSTLDVEFQNALKLAGEEDWKPDRNWADAYKSIYVSIYYGWLVGKGRYVESDYK